MKRLWTCLYMAAVMLIFSGLLVSTVGCKKNTQPPPAWAATAPVIRVPGDVIAAANAAVIGFEKDQAHGSSYTLDPVLKATISDIQKALVIAQPVFKTWEQALKTNPSAPQPPALTNAITTIQADMGKLPASLRGK